MQAVNATLRFGQSPLQAAEETLLQAILSSQVRLTLRGHTGGVNGVAYSPDGKRIGGQEDEPSDYVVFRVQGSGRQVLDLK
jgi:hypothetical protein